MPTIILITAVMPEHIAAVKDVKAMRCSTGVPQYPHTFMPSILATAVLNGKSKEVALPIHIMEPKTAAEMRQVRDHFVKQLDLMIDKYEADYEPAKGEAVGQPDPSRAGGEQPREAVRDGLAGAGANQDPGLSAGSGAGPVKARPEDTH